MTKPLPLLIAAACAFSLFSCAPAFANDDLPVMAFDATPDGATVAFDALAVRDAAAQPGGLKWEPAKWWRKNWKPVVGTVVVVGGAWAAYEIYDSSKSKKSSSPEPEPTPEPEPEPALPTIGGDQTVIVVSGQGNVVSYYSTRTPPVATAAPVE
jgi:hypothetical protein